MDNISERYRGLKFDVIEEDKWKDEIINGEKKWKRWRRRIGKRRREKMLNGRIRRKVKVDIKEELMKCRKKVKKMNILKRKLIKWK